MRRQAPAWLALLFGFTGFALAAPIYGLLQETPEFLVARQNTLEDARALALTLSLLLPLALWAPALLMALRWPPLARAWVLAVGGLLAAAFLAQLLPWRELPAAAHLALVLIPGLALAGVMLFTRWRVLALVLAVMAAVFPLQFLLGASLPGADGGGASPAGLPGHALETRPDIVFVVLDELSLITLLGPDLEVDQRNFPAFARLAGMSDWYVDTLSVSDVTVSSVPAILSGRSPSAQGRMPTIADEPVNLFTLLEPHYRLNVAETVTSLCPRSSCPSVSVRSQSRFTALLLDLAAVYLHRVLPADWRVGLPEVDNNWSGFFAQRQVFFPAGWMEQAGEQTLVDRPAYVRAFIDSLRPGPGGEPSLNFLHILFPHEPLAYLPGGDHYGHAWLRGNVEGLWDESQWGALSAMQRHFLQVRLADALLGELLDHMESQRMLDEALLVLVSDHGASFRPGHYKRQLDAGNAADLLRVPLFIKAPGQHEGRRRSRPAMTTDILPTVLGQLGVESAPLGFEGLDLGSQAPAGKRPRRAWSSSTKRLRTISQEESRIREGVARHRRLLRLDEDPGSIWRIGPLDTAAGRPVEDLCEPVEADWVDRRFEPRPLEAAPLDRFVPAYIAGRVSGADAPEEALPFIIANLGRVVASGRTWKHRRRWQYFALVEPGQVSRADWDPRIALVRDGRCLFARNGTALAVPN